MQGSECRAHSSELEGHCVQVQYLFVFAELASQMCRYQQHLFALDQHTLRTSLYSLCYHAFVLHMLIEVTTV